MVLSELTRDEQVVIVDVDGEGSVKDQLQSFGFVPGAIVSFVNKLAFGGAMAFSLHGSKVALRKSDADRILVAPVS